MRMLHCDHVLLFARDFYFDDMHRGQAFFIEDLKLEGFIDGGEASCNTNRGAKDKKFLMAKP